MNKNVFEGKIFDLQADVYTNIPNAFLELEKKHISHYAKWLFVLLKKYAGSNGKAIPSTKEIAKKLICSDRMVQYALNELKEKGYLLKFNRFIIGGKYDKGQLANGYVLLKVNDETGFPRPITSPEIYYAMTIAEELESNIKWVIEDYFVKKYNLILED